MKRFLFITQKQYSRVLIIYINNKQFIKTVHVQWLVIRSPLPALALSRCECACFDANFSKAWITPFSLRSITRHAERFIIIIHLFQYSCPLFVE